MKINQQMFKFLYKVMFSLGLSESESLLYLTSLQAGPLTISDLAKQINVARPNIYKIIKRLEEKGLAKYSEKSHSHLFVVESPTKVLELLREKRQFIIDQDRGLANMMPDILSLYHQGNNPSKIKILTGKEDFLSVFKSIIDNSDGGGEFFGSAEDFVNFVTLETEKKWIKKRVKRNIIIKVLLLPSEFAQSLIPRDKIEKRETRILRPISPFTTSFQLFSHTVILWQPKTPMAIVIEDEYFVAMFRAIFNFMWEFSG